MLQEKKAKEAYLSKNVQFYSHITVPYNGAFRACCPPAPARLWAGLLNESILLNYTLDSGRDGPFLDGRVLKKVCSLS